MTAEQLAKCAAWGQKAQKEKDEDAPPPNKEALSEMLKLGYTHDPITRMRLPDPDSEAFAAGWPKLQKLIEFINKPPNKENAEKVTELAEGIRSLLGA